MCGIAGYFGKQNIGEERLNAALDSMRQRGPDHRQLWKQEGGSVNAYLLHARLSIIDLDPRSHQPMQLGPFILIFNGELYNYKELKKELEGPFETESDTEVLLRKFQDEGLKCFERFEGMWALAILDTRDMTLLLSRDRFGEKPLYLHREDDGVYFASETSTLKVLSGKRFEKNLDQVKRLLVNGHKSLYKQPSTFYHDVDELDLHTNLIVHPNMEERKESYWNPKFQPQESMTEVEAIQGIRENMVRAVKLRMRSDVPLAFCLSGGIDSSSLVSIAAKELNAKVNTFSIIDSDTRYNEQENIEETIRDTGCNHHLVHLDPTNNYLNELEDLIAYHDAPVATISYFVHSLLSKAIQANGFKISISGTAADELFTGYYDHFVLHFYEMRNHPDLKQLISEWEKHQLGYVRHPSFRKHDLYFDDPTIRDHIYLNSDEFGSYLKNDFAQPFVEAKYSDSLLRNRMMNELFHEVVRVILHEDDLNSMKYSIENRSPFLDKDLFEFAYSIPSRHLINDGYAKYLLRSAMNGILNDKVRLSREKKGFNASINSFVDFDNQDHIAYLLDDSKIFELVEKTKIETLLKRGEYPNSFKKFLFNFINTKIWLEQP